MIKDEELDGNFSNPKYFMEVDCNFYKKLSEFKKTIVDPKIINKITEELIYSNNRIEQESLLQFDLKSLNEFNFDNFFLKFDKFCVDLKNVNCIYGLYLFVNVKYLTQIAPLKLNNQIKSEELIIKRLNFEFTDNYDELFKNEVLWAYRNKLFLSETSYVSESDKCLLKEKEVYRKDYSPEKLSLNFKNNLLSKMNKNIDIIINSFYLNQLSFIHFLEFSIGLQKESLDKSLNFDNSLIRLNLITGYFMWRSKLEQNETHNFSYDEILIYFLKYSILNSLELLITLPTDDQTKEQHCFNFLNTLFSIFSLISVLIIYVKILMRTRRSSTELFRKYIHSVNLTKGVGSPPIIFFQKLLGLTQITEFSSLTNEIVMLIKLLEYFFILKYNKGLKEISQTLKVMNHTDFLLNNLFLYGEVYDVIQKSYSSFKEKIFWNFGEILSIVYNPIFPKMFKKTLLRHIEYMPHNESLIYHLIQYYYSNKDYRKSKILIMKILVKKNINSVLLFDIQSIALMMIVNIFSYSEKIGEALDLAIYNLERIKEFRNNLNISNNELTETDSILIRSYLILGFCYSKIADDATNYVEKNKYSSLALCCFKEAKDNLEISISNSGKNVYCENPNLIFFLARQFYEVKLFNEAEELLLKIEQNNDVGKYIYNPHYIALKVLIQIAILKYDKAFVICDRLLKAQGDLIRYNTIVVLKYYLVIHKLINSEKKDEENFILEICDDVMALNEKLEKEIKNYDNLISNVKSNKKEKITKFVENSLVNNNGRVSQNSEKYFMDSNLGNKTQNLNIQFSKEQQECKELIKFSNFDPFNNDVISDEDLKSSIKTFTYEKKNLEYLKTELIKNFYLLLVFIRENNFDKNKSLENVLSSILSKSNITGPNDDSNLLIIKGIQLQIEKKDSEAESLYKKVLESNPVNMTALKTLAKLLLDKNDLSNAYIYINKAIKLDEQETDLWNMLSTYYMFNGDNAKYYECVLKEFEVAKYHCNSFLSGLITKVMI